MSWFDDARACRAISEVAAAADGATTSEYEYAFGTAAAAGSSLAQAAALAPYSPRAAVEVI